MYREISPQKILAKRAKRSRRDIAVASENKITEQDLWGYETGAWRPSKKKLPHLLKALNATYNEISETVELVSI